MACYSPLKAWYSKDTNANGKRPMVFSPKYALDPDLPIELACNQCVGCRLERSRQWAVRCLHESSLYDRNCFITLTFNDEELKKRDNPWTLDVRDYQLFMKRLRKRFGDGIRFFHCGEYGEKYGRPHYHALLFNFDFDDRVLRTEYRGHKYYVSKTLSELWPYGWAVIGDVTFESAAYVARYIMKKVNGDMAEEHYQWADPDTGEVFPLKPEYITMSRRPGIAKGWFDKYGTDVYPKDFITVNGEKYRPPKFYDKIIESLDPIEFDVIKERRIERAESRSHELTPERLKVREKIAQLKARKLRRTHDEVNL